MMFRHLTNTLALAVVASIVFMFWSIKYHMVARHYWKSVFLETLCQIRCERNQLFCAFVKL